VKIISPIDNRAEVEPLLEAGADELYGGYVPPEWRQRFSGLASINQRTFEAAQIDSLDDLRAIVDSAHSAGVPFSLTLNAPFYSDDQLPLIVDFVGEMCQLGVDGVILADIALLRSLKGLFAGLELHASTLAHLGNSGAVRKFVDEGISRVIFPRHIPVAEMKSMMQHFPDIVFDAFLLVGKCPNTEGLCSFHHSSSDRVWPCEIPYRIEPEGEMPSPELLAAIERQNSWSQTNRRHGCGLCAIPALIEARLSGAKLVGRGAPTPQKVNNVVLVRDFIGLAASEPDFDRYRQQAIAAHKKRFGSPCSPNVCYYPEFYRAE